MNSTMKPMLSYRGVLNLITRIMCYAEEVPERGRNEVGNLKRQIELSGYHHNWSCLLIFQPPVSHVTSLLS